VPPAWRHSVSEDEVIDWLNETLGSGWTMLMDLATAHCVDRASRVNREALHDLVRPHGYVAQHYPRSPDINKQENVDPGSGCRPAPQPWPNAEVRRGALTLLEDRHQRVHPTEKQIIDAALDATESMNHPTVLGSFVHNIIRSYWSDKDGAFSGSIYKRVIAAKGKTIEQRKR
jgi:hypothetical protein